MSSTLEKMRKAHEKQAQGIRRKPGFDAVSKAFDYATACDGKLKVLGV